MIERSRTIPGRLRSTRGTSPLTLTGAPPIRPRASNDQAVADFTKAIEIAPRAEAYKNRGNAFQAEGDLDRAIADFDKAIEMNPNDADSYNNRGAAYKAKGENERAIADFSKALDIDPRLCQDLLQSCRRLPS